MAAIYSVKDVFFQMKVFPGTLGVEGVIKSVETSGGKLTIRFELVADNSRTHQFIWRVSIPLSELHEERNQIRLTFSELTGATFESISNVVVKHYGQRYEAVDEGE